MDVLKTCEGCGASTYKEVDKKYYECQYCGRCYNSIKSSRMIINNHGSIIKQQNIGSVVVNEGNLYL